MARATLPPGSSGAQATHAPAGVSDEPHTPPAADGSGGWKRLYQGDLTFAEVDILGSLDVDRRIAGNALLAELRGRTVDDETPEGRAVLDFGHDQLATLAFPAGDLADVALKLAWCVRMNPGSPGQATYDEATTRLLGSALADVILLRQAELVRRSRLSREGRADG